MLALARRGMRSREGADATAPWLALHVGDGPAGSSCRLHDDEAFALGKAANDPPPRGAALPRPATTKVA